MAESILGRLGGAQFNAFSAGSHPTGRINPLALEELGRQGYPATGLFSKSWDQFLRPDAPVLDYVITVCERAASQPHPPWPGNPKTFLWPFPAPGDVQGTDEEVRAVFHAVFLQIENAITEFLRQAPPAAAASPSV